MQDTAKLGGNINLEEAKQYGRQINAVPGHKMLRLIVLHEFSVYDEGDQDQRPAYYKQHHFLTEDRKKYIEKAVRNGVPLDEAFWMACFQE